MYEEKIKHYYISTSRCVKNLIGLSKLSVNAKIDTDRLREILKLLDGAVKLK